MGSKVGPNFVRDGLVFFLDSSNVKSYTSSTTWYDLTTNGYSASLINGPTFDSTDSGGAIVLDNVNDYIQLNSTASINYDQTNNFTMEVGHRFSSDFGNWRLDNLNWPILSNDSGIFNKGQGGSFIIGVDVTNSAYTPGVWWKASKTFVDNNGKIVIVGGFTSYDTTNCNGIVRLSSTGSVDQTFLTNIGSGFTSYCYDAATQSNNKIIVAGGFTSFNGSTAGRICRLNTDGTFDSTFNINGSGFNGDVNSIWVDSSDNIYCGGAFGSFNGSSNRNNFAILSSTGSFLYTSPNNGINSTVYKVYGTTYGVYLGGSFFAPWSGSGVTFSKLVRVTSTGSYDTTFNYNTIGFNNTVYSITSDVNGYIYVGGDFDTYNGSSYQKIIRLTNTASVEPTFSIGTGFTNSNIITGTVFSIVPVGTQSIYVGGSFRFYNGASCSCATRLSYTGSVDSSWPSTLGIDQGSNNTNSTTVNAVFDFNFIGSNILLSGKFNNWLGVQKNRLVLVSSTGSIVTATSSWYSGSGLNWKNLYYRYRYGVRGTNLSSGLTLYMDNGLRGTYSNAYLSLVHIYGTPSNTVNAYLNGLLTSSFTYSNNVIITSPQPYRINSNTAVGGNSSYTAGKIYFTRLYSRSLSSDEINQNYQAYRYKYGL